MSRCIKTGAKVFINEYGATIQSDIHEADGCIVINFNPQSWQNNGDRSTSTHHITIGNGYINRDKGIIVNPSYYMTHKVKDTSI